MPNHRRTDHAGLSATMGMELAISRTIVDDWDGPALCGAHERREAGISRRPFSSEFEEEGARRSAAGTTLHAVPGYSPATP
jgi:hypothetical protein